MKQRQAAVIGALYWNGAQNLTELCTHTGYRAGSITAALSELERAGTIVSSWGHATVGSRPRYYRLTHPTPMAEIRTVLNEADSLLGLARHRGEAGTAIWNAECDGLIIKIRKVIREMQP